MLHRFPTVDFSYACSCILQIKKNDRKKRIFPKVSYISGVSLIFVASLAQALVSKVSE